MRIVSALYDDLCVPLRPERVYPVHDPGLVWLHTALLSGELAAYVDAPGAEQAAAVPFIILGVSSIVYGLSDLINIIRFRQKKEPGMPEIEDITPIEEIKD